MSGKCQPYLSHFTHVKAGTFRILSNQFHNNKLERFVSLQYDVYIFPKNMYFSKLQRFIVS